MAKKAHELLKIAPDQLKEDDIFIQTQYTAAVTEAKKKSWFYTSASTLEKLKNAFEELETPELRVKYRERLEAAPEKQAHLYIPNRENASIIKEAYLQFVRDNYKSTRLEHSKPEEHFFKNKNAFEKSALYADIPVKTRSSISQFPCKITRLTFASKEDAQKFIQELAEKKGITLQADPPTASTSMRMRP